MTARSRCRPGRARDIAAR